MIWLFSLLPNWIFHLIVLVGILGLIGATFFGYIPFIGKYTIPVKIVSILLLVAGVWFEGGLSNNEAWMDKVHVLEKKIAEAEAKSAQANTILTSKIAEKNKEIASVQTLLKNRIKQFTTIMDSECKISPETISILNDAAMTGPKGGKK